MRTFFLAAAFAALGSSAADAQKAAPAAPAARTMTCPIGGGSFPFVQVAPPVVRGERPDGRPYGNVKFPLTLPECPDNGLVFYKDYGPEDVAKLEPLILSAPYKALRKEETQYYRAYWLMREIGEPPERYLWALLQAGWEADGRPELRKRYLTELAEASAKVPPRPGDLNWVGMEGRAVNALRELGRFDEALARLDKVPVAGLESSAGGSAQARARGWRTFLTAIRPVIERKDPSPEPLDLIPRAIAYGRCIDAPAKLDETGRAFCQKEATGVAALKASREKLAKEAEALRRSREASGR
ncbi:MAG TPA: hypothetical protein VF650_03610 [Allosphingosinicella sp.]|jgi:hypothetical protein